MRGSIVQSCLYTCGKIEAKAKAEKTEEARDRACEDANAS